MDRYCDDFEELQERFLTHFRALKRGGDEVLVVATQDTYPGPDYRGQSNVDCLLHDYAQLILEYDGPYYRAAYVNTEDLLDPIHCKYISRVLYYLEENGIWNESHLLDLLHDNGVDSEDD